MSEAQKVEGSGGPVIPDKLYFRIGEVARLLDVETHTLRFWETEFPQLKIGKGGTGQRLYRRRDVELVAEVKTLLYRDGYTIPGARQLLQARFRGEKSAEKPELPRSHQSGLERIRNELRDLSTLLDDGKPALPEPARGRKAASPQPARRGLHLANRPAKVTGVTRPSPGLFDATSESEPE